MAVTLSPQERLLLKARDLADPATGDLLGARPPVKEVIRDLLAEVERLREERSIMLIDFESVVEERNEARDHLARIPEDWRNAGRTLADMAIRADRAETERDQARAELRGIEAARLARQARFAALREATDAIEDNRA